MPNLQIYQCWSIIAIYSQDFSYPKSCRLSQTATLIYLYGCIYPPQLFLELYITDDIFSFHCKHRFLLIYLIFLVGKEISLKISVIYTSSQLYFLISWSHDILLIISFSSYLNFPPGLAEILQSTNIMTIFKISQINFLFLPSVITNNKEQNTTKLLSVFCLLTI